MSEQGALSKDKRRYASRVEVFYVYDPLCGWCYALSDVIRRIDSHYREVAEVKAISGGMIVGDRVHPMGEMAEYIKSVLPRLTEMSGARFGEPWLRLLDEGAYLHDSAPPSVALTVLKDLAPGRSIRVAADIQRAFFQEGKSLNDPQTFVEIAADHGVGREAFLSAFHSPVYFEKTLDEFHFARELGVTGFPTLIAKSGEGTQVLARGFAPYETVASSLDSLLRAG